MAGDGAAGFLHDYLQRDPQRPFVEDGGDPFGDTVFRAGADVVADLAADTSAVADCAVTGATGADDDRDDLAFGEDLPRGRADVREAAEPDRDGAVAAVLLRTTKPRRSWCTRVTLALDSISARNVLILRHPVVQNR